MAVIFGRFKNFLIFFEKKNLKEMGGGQKISEKLRGERPGRRLLMSFALLISTRIVNEN